MKNSKIVLCIGSSLVAAALGSVALNAQAWPIVIQPSINIGIPAPVVVAPAPVYVQPAPVYVEPAPVVEYAPGPFDVYINAAPPADIVFIGGVTYIWGVDAYGHRERHFYGNGDRRAELFHRQEELRRVAARNGGHLPPHGETHAEAMAHEQARVAAVGGRPGGPAPGNHGGPAPQQQQQRGGNEHGNNGHEHEH